MFACEGGERARRMKVVNRREGILGKRVLAIVGGRVEKWKEEV